MTKWVEQSICIKFCIKLECSSMETIQMIQKATAMGNWWLAASSLQHTCSCITSHAEFCGETSNQPGDSAPPEPSFGALQLLAFPKTKITFEREEISDHQQDSGKYDGAADGDWRTVWGPKVLTLKGLRHHCPMMCTLCTMFLVSCILFNKCLYFFLLHV